MIRGDVHIIPLTRVKGEDACLECGEPLYLSVATAVELQDAGGEALEPIVLGRACCRAHAERAINDLCNAALYRESEPHTIAAPDPEADGDYRERRNKKK